VATSGAVRAEQLSKITCMPRGGHGLVDRFEEGRDVGDQFAVATLITANTSEVLSRADVGNRRGPALDHRELGFGASTLPGIASFSSKQGSVFAGASR